MRRQARTHRTKLINQARKAEGFHHYEWRDGALFVLSIYHGDGGDMMMFLPINRPIGLPSIPAPRPFGESPPVKIKLIERFTTEITPDGR